MSGATDTDFSDVVFHESLIPFHFHTKMTIILVMMMMMPLCAIFLQHFNASLSHYLPGEELLIGGRRPPKWQEVSPERKVAKESESERTGERWRKISRPLFTYHSFLLSTHPNYYSATAFSSHGHVADSSNSHKRVKIILNIIHQNITFVQKVLSLPP